MGKRVAAAEALQRAEFKEQLSHARREAKLAHLFRTSESSRDHRRSWLKDADAAASDWFYAAAGRLQPAHCKSSVRELQLAYSARALT